MVFFPAVYGAELLQCNFWVEVKMIVAEKQLLWKSHVTLEIN